MNSRLIGLLAVMVVLAGVAGYVWYNKLKDEGVIDEPADAEAKTVKYDELRGLTVTDYHGGTDPTRSGENASFHLSLNFENDTPHEVAGVKVRLDVYGVSGEEPVFSQSQWFGGFTDQRTNMRGVLLPHSRTVGSGIYAVPQAAYSSLQSGGRWQFELEEVQYFDDPSDLTKPNHLFALLARGDFTAFKLALEKDPSLLNLDTRLVGSTAAHVAAAYDDVGALSFLADKGTALDIEGRPGVSPLMVAAVNGSSRSMGFLISKGVQLEAHDALGSTALAYATKGSHIQAAEALLAAGAKVDAADGQGQTPLHVAALAGDVGFVKFLLKAGAGIDIKDSAGRTPLHVATFSRSLEVVKELVKQRAKLDAVDQQGYSVLHYAAAAGDEGIVKYVATLRIDKRLKDATGRTAEDVAYEAGNDEIAKYLRP